MTDSSWGFSLSPSQVVEASGGPLFASEIHSPMLTLEAVTLLRGCLRPEELELWHLLGENWTQPRYLLTWWGDAMQEGWGGSARSSSLN